MLSLPCGNENLVGLSEYFRVTWCMVKAQQSKDAGLLSRNPVLVQIMQCCSIFYLTTTKS